MEAGKHKLESLTIRGGPFRLQYISEADLFIDLQHFDDDWELNTASKHQKKIRMQIQCTEKMDKKLMVLVFLFPERTYFILSYSDYNCTK